MIMVGHADITGNVIAANSAETGGGIYLYGASYVTIQANVITGNIASGIAHQPFDPVGGGGLLAGDGTVTVTGNLILSNTTGHYGGGAYFVHRSQALLINNIIADNTALGYGDGIAIGGATARMAHNTLVNNGGLLGSGMYIDSYSWFAPEMLYSSVWITNTIVASHTPGIYVTANNVAILNSTLWHGNDVDMEGTGAITHTHDYTGSPAFVAPASGNYHIGPASAAIDRGIDAGVASDIDGHFRDSLPDLGADEYITQLQVDTPIDSNDPAYQACTPAPGDCSLRGAISHVNADNSHSYALILPSGAYSLTLPGAKEDANASGDLDILTSTLIISRTGSGDAVIDGNRLDRVLHIHPGATVQLDGLTITGGKTPDETGARVDATEGGGIYNAGILTLDNTTVISNATGHGGPGECMVPQVGDGGPGAGIYSNNTLLLRHSTVISNAAGASGTGCGLIGMGGPGAGIYNDSGVVTLDSSHIQSNRGSTDTWGVGLYNHAGTMTLDNSTVQHNLGYGVYGALGGGIYNGAGGNLTLVDSLVADNGTAPPSTFLLGGGIANYNDSTLILDNSAVQHNQAILGGGIFNQGTLTMLASSVSSNTAEAGGGISASDDSTIVISDTTIAGNHASQNVMAVEASGGGIRNSGRLTLVNSTITGNSAEDNGGGIHNQGSLTLTHVTIVSNTCADGDGGGLFGNSATAMHNSIVAANTDVGGQAPDITGTLTSHGYNLIGDLGAATFDNNTAGDQYGDPNGTTLPNPGAVESGSPIDPRLGSLAANGGPTHSLLPLPFSPAIDAIPPLSCTLTLDQRAAPRPIEEMCDIGAVELELEYAPVATADAYTATGNAPLGVSAPGVLQNDVDGDWDPLTALVDTPPLVGVLDLSVDGSFIYTPGQDGVVTFIYGAFDGSGLATATVTITVTGINNAPVAGDDAFDVDEDSTDNVLDVLDGDSDADGDALEVWAVSDPPNGTAVDHDTDVLYTPDPDFFGSDTFTYTVSDGNGGLSSAAVTVSVSNVNDAPVAVDDVYTTPDDTVLVVPAPGVLLNDGDVDGDPLTANLQPGSTLGTLNLGFDGSFVYSPTSGFSGAVVFTYTVSDGNGGSDVGKVTITVTQANAYIYLPMILKNAGAVPQIRRNTHESNRSRQVRLAQGCLGTQGH